MICYSLSFFFDFRSSEIRLEDMVGVSAIVENERVRWTGLFAVWCWLAKEFPPSGILSFLPVSKSFAVLYSDPVYGKLPFWLLESCLQLSVSTYVSTSVYPCLRLCLCLSL